MPLLSQKKNNSILKCNAFIFIVPHILYTNCLGIQLTHQNVMQMSNTSDTRFRSGLEHMCVFNANWKYLTSDTTLADTNDQTYSFNTVHCYTFQTDVWKVFIDSNFLSIIIDNYNYAVYLLDMCVLFIRCGKPLKKKSFFW